MEKLRSRNENFLLSRLGHFEDVRRSIPFMPCGETFQETGLRCQILAETARVVNLDIKLLWKRSAINFERAQIIARSGAIVFGLT